eukprot:gene26845-biopygen17434
MNSRGIYFKLDRDGNDEGPARKSTSWRQKLSGMRLCKINTS